MPTSMEDETVERLTSIFAMKMSLANRDRYQAQGRPEKQRIEGETQAYQWSQSLIERLSDEETDKVLQEVEERLESQLE